MADTVAHIRIPQDLLADIDQEAFRDSRSRNWVIVDRLRKSSVFKNVARKTDPAVGASLSAIAQPAQQHASVEQEDDSSFDFSDDTRITQGFKETEYDDSDEFKQ